MQAVSRLCADMIRATSLRAFTAAGSLFNMVLVSINKCFAIYLISVIFSLTSAVYGNHIILGEYSVENTVLSLLPCHQVKFSTLSDVAFARGLRESSRSIHRRLAFAHGTAASWAGVEEKSDVLYKNNIMRLNFSVVDRQIWSMPMYVAFLQSLLSGLPDVYITAPVGFTVAFLHQSDVYNWLERIRDLAMQKLSDTNNNRTIVVAPIGPLVASNYKALLSSYNSHLNFPGKIFGPGPSATVLGLNTQRVARSCTTGYLVFGLQPFLSLDIQLISRNDPFTGDYQVAKELCPDIPLFLKISSESPPYFFVPQQNRDLQERQHR